MIPAHIGRVVAVLCAIVVITLVAAGASARVHVLTRGKLIRFENQGVAAENGGRVIVGRDRVLRTLYDPTCPATSSVDVEAYLQSTLRDATLAHVELDCAKWSAHGGGFTYADPTGTVRSIQYLHSALQMEIRGAGFTPIGGPVGYVQAQLRIGDETLRARFHNFRRNDAAAVVSRVPSTAGAFGEAAFWDLMYGDMHSEASQQFALGALEKAVHGNPRDGRSHFLLAMLHLYRFGQRVTRIEDADAAARAEIAAANAAFATAVPLLWDDATATGGSRVPGFAAAAKYLLGAVEQDDGLRAEGLADLARSVAVNSFFNVFDYIPVMQVLPPSDPAFQQAYASFVAYLNDPEILRCVSSQPELCANAGFAPRNIQGALTLFGDVYVKGGDLAAAQRWYDLVNLFPETASWKFAAVIADRVANAASRVALYADADPSNDPPLIGAGPEACAVCHNR